MKTLLAIIVALGIPTAFWTYQAKETPDIQYSISASLPLAFEEKDKKISASEYIQQIEIANLGKSEAKKITIKLNSPISQVHVSKHSSLENVQTIKNDGGFELVYESLPPSTSFLLTTKSQRAISPQEVTVFHQGGKGKFLSVGSKNSDFGFVDAFWLLVPILNILFIYTSLKDDLRYRYAFRNYTPNIIDILKSKRPWYIPEKEWHGVFTDLVERAISKTVPIYSAPVTWPQYQLLNANFPIDIPSDKWSNLKDIATAKFLESIKAKGQRAHNKDEVHDLLNLKWPIGISESDRGSITNDLSNIYLNLLKKSFSATEIAQAIHLDKKPPAVPTQAWEKFKDSLETYFFGKIIESIIEDITTNIDDLPETKAIPPHSRYRISRIRQLQSKLNSSEERIKAAKELNDHAEELKHEISMREIKILATEKQSQELLTKVVRQLDTIDKIIKTPSYIDRIEPYDNTFAPGNWDLLRKISSIAQKN